MSHPAEPRGLQDVSQARANGVKHEDPIRLHRFNLIAT